MESFAYSNLSKVINVSYFFTQVRESTDLNYSTNRTVINWSVNLQDRIDYFFNQPHFLVDLILGLSTLLANGISIAAIFHIKRPMTTHIRLIVSLNAADLLVSASVLLHLLNKLFNPVIPPNMYTPDERLGPACTIAFVFALHQMATQLSILNVMAMAVDHYLAVIKPLAYLTNSSKRQWLGVIVTIWFVSLCGGFSAFLSGFNTYKKARVFFNYCECITTFGDFHPEFFTWSIAVIAALTIIFIYIRICCEVCYVNSKMTNIRQGYIKNQKAIKTTLVIIATFVICWLPTCFFQIVMVIQVYTDKSVIQDMIKSFFQINKYLNHLYLLNSFMDPLIYAFRLREMQLGYRRLFLRCSQFKRFCRRGSKRYTSNFRYNKDLTSITSTAERGYLVHLPDSCLPRHEFCRLVLPRQRYTTNKGDLRPEFSESRSPRDQTVPLQEINNQQSSKPCACSCRRQAVGQGCSRRSKRSHSCVCLTTSNIGLAYKNRYRYEKSAKKSFRFSHSRALTISSPGCVTENDNQWCQCTSSV